MKPSILVVDDQPSWQKVADDLLSQEYDVDFAETYASATEKLKDRHPPYHVLIADIRLKDGDPDDTSGLEVVKCARELGGHTNIIIWTAYPEISTAKSALRDLDAVDYIEKTFRFDDQAFRSLVKSFVDASNLKRWPAQILLVDNNSSWTKEIESLLTQEGYLVHVEQNYAAASQKLHRQFRLLIVDIAIDKGHIDRGLDFVREIAYVSPETKVIILTAGGTKRTVRDAFVNLGVVDFFFKNGDADFDKKAFLKEVKEIFRPINERFIIAQFRNIEPNGELVVDHEYTFLVTARETVIRVDQSTTPVFLPPRKDAIEIEVVLYVDGDNQVASIAPTTRQTWVVPTQGHIYPISFSIIPKKPGRLSIHVELYGDTNWWRRLAQTVIVNPIEPTIRTAEV